jgi:hypothetical protein
MQNPLEAFNALLGYVRERETKVLGAQNLEMEYLKTLQCIKRHPDLRAPMVEIFSNLLQDKAYGRYMVLQFCMHDLRWPEMRNAAKAIYAQAQMDLIRQQLHGTASQHLMFLEEVVGSFEDTWSSKTLFKYYAT